jgi:hypothetical protein
MFELELMLREKCIMPRRNEMKEKPLLRSAVIDHGPLCAIQNLIFGPLSPLDLPLVEQALRAFLTVEELRPFPFVEREKGIDFHKDVLAEDSSNSPIGDGILDYEFTYEPNSLPILPSIDREERQAIDKLVATILEKTFAKSIYDLTATDLAKVINSTYMAHELSWLLGDNEVFSLGTDKSLYIVYGLSSYLRTLVRFHRSGAVVFSEGLVGDACQEYLFSRYPASIFDQLDEDWQKYVRYLTGPGIGVVLPPILACVLSRVNNRDEIPMIIRDIRQEYQSSRKSLWDYLEEMWFAPTLKKQLRLLSKLEAASANLFRASFPERFPFLQTAFSTVIKAADLKPLSAMEEIGKALLKKDESTSRVSAIGFTRQLSLDMRRIKGMDKLLSKVLTRAETSEFGLSK